MRLVARKKNFYEMDFTQRRVRNGPGYSKLGEATKDFDLDDDAGFGEQTAAACWWSGLDLALASTQLLGATVTFGAISSGFVGTSLAVLTSLGTPVMKKIRRTQYIHILRGYMGWALASGVMLSLVSIVGMFPALKSLELAAAWGAALIFCITCLWRLARVMLLVFSDPENLPNDS